ncbi:MAG TPA: HlyD family secretion protein [Stellaceae bacterium]|nr:HlyD family secretion protein [Stellaceae bacterium]
MSGVTLPRAAVHLPGRSLLRFSRKQLILAALALVIAAGGAAFGPYWWTTGRFIESTNDAYVGGNVTVLAPHVAGFVSQIVVVDNQYVKAGDLLVTLDDRDYRAKLAHAEAVVQRQQATLANLRAQYRLQQSMIGQAEASLSATQAAATFADQEATRYRALAATTYGSLQNDQKASAASRQAQANVSAAEATLAAAKQKLAVIDTETAQTEADLAQAQADRDTAQLELSYTEIRSPVDGYVGDRAARVGAYVTTGTNLLSIVPAHGLWVDANFKEDQLAHMRAGQTVAIVADVLPGRTFEGHVASLAPATGAVFAVIPPENATGNFTKIVQRVPVRIELTVVGATLGALRPGLSVTASVDTRDAVSAARMSGQVK